VPLAILALAALALGWIWGFQDELRQNQFLGSVIVSGSAAILLLLWFVFLTRFSRRLRWVSLLAAVAIVVGFLAAFRVEEVTGDMVPTFRPRWAQKPDELLPKLDVAPNANEETATTNMLSTISPRDWPRFLGANIDGVIRGVEIERDWEAYPPKELWRRDLGAAWSSFAIVGSRAVTQEQRGDDELVVCYDVASGAVVWAHSDLARYDTAIAGVGPRATPTVHDGRVYSVGATGILNCLDGATGRRVWSVDVVKIVGAKMPDWGMSCSPLIAGDLVIVAAPGGAGKSLLAFDLVSGAAAWTSGGAKASYSSPMLATLAGVEQILLLAHQAVIAHDPKSGDLLWQHPWQGSHPKVSQPVVVGGNRVLVSSGYGIGCELIEVSRQDDVFSTRQVWKNRNLKSKFANIIVHDGFAYGLDDGIMVCIDLEDEGKRRWKSTRYGHGQLLLVGDTLLLTEENSGDVVIVDPTPDEHRALGRLDALESRTWNPPALAGDLLLVRNATEVVCYRLELRKR
jgi:outer membrane protein assembly factor BamB